MNQKTDKLYKSYIRGLINRREFFEKLALIAGGTAAVFALLPSFDARADIISADDPQLDSEMTTYPGESGKVQAYLAKPKGKDKLPAVIIIHENRGLQPIAVRLRF